MGCSRKKKNPLLFSFLFSFVELFLEEEEEEGDEVQREKEGGLRDSVVVIRLEEEY